MRLKDIASSVGLGVFVLLAALLGVHFDLQSYLYPAAPAVPPDASAPVEAAHAKATKRIGLASVGAGPVDRRPAEAPAAKTSSSTFDVVRIAPDGYSVFAGRAPANSNITVFANDKPVATAKANADGEWSAVIDRQFAPGDYKLSLTAKPDGTDAQSSGQSVNITIASNALLTPKETKVVAVAAAPPVSVPAPIMFPYDAASIATVGRKQAEELSAFLRQRRPAVVTLSGHADDRGSDAYNMQLSQQRLESVARYLRASGYTGELVLVPKGRSEPFTGAERAKLSKEEAYQFDRRVELRHSPK